MMTNLLRRSPAWFTATPVTVENRNNWTVVLSYDNEGHGPYLVDLSHHPRWDIQDSQLDATGPLELGVPETIGSCGLKNGILINRMNRTQAAIWHLTTETPHLPDAPCYTDVTDSTVFLALFGPHTFSITEKLTSLDFPDPAKDTPFLLQGPFSHVPCQIVTLERGPDQSGGILLTCSRGYANSMIHAITDAGSAFGLRPAGEMRFMNWMTGQALAASR
ncbi:MAG: sarcosine oxidase subunit gamma SoxG [Desulfatirhabdiaceae bacterium]